MPTYSRMTVRHQMLQPIDGFSESERYRPIPPATVVAISSSNRLTRPPGKGAIPELRRSRQPNRRLARDHLVDQPTIVDGPVAIRVVVEDRLPEPSSLGQPNVPPNS